MPEKRKKISTRLRFEIFKRDGFTCRYCGRKSPEVVLELEHIVPVADGGSDDEMNLATACWDCNSGKGAVPLLEIMTGESPHDKAILILEKERQLREYEAVRAMQERRYDENMQWLSERFEINEDTSKAARNALREFSVYDVADALSAAISKTDGRHPYCVRYFCGILRNWRKNGGAR